MENALEEYNLLSNQLGEHLYNEVLSEFISKNQLINYLTYQDATLTVAEYTKMELSIL